VRVAEQEGPEGTDVVEVAIAVGVPDVGPCAPDQDRGLAPDGTVEWMCLPRFDSPSIFSALLDRGAGGFRLAPYGIEVSAARRYDPGTNVLETMWMTPSGWAR